MPEMSIFPQIEIPNYSETQDESLQKAHDIQTGGELQDFVSEKVRRVYVRGQIDGE